MSETARAVIEALADSEASLLEQLAIVAAAKAAYREVAVAAIHHAHDLEVRLQALQSRYDALLAEYRTLRWVRAA